MRMVIGCSLQASARQRGVALYVAMVLLLLVSLIGVAALQVATMQQRMAVNFNDFALAFQRAEGVLRQGEFDLQWQIDADPNRLYDFCVINANAWGDAVQPQSVPEVSVRELVGGATCPVSVGGGNPMTEGPADNRRFQLTAAAADREAANSPTAVIVVETVFEVPPAITPP